MCFGSIFRSGFESEKKRTIRLRDRHQWTLPTCYKLLTYGDVLITSMTNNKQYHCNFKKTTTSFFFILCIRFDVLIYIFTYSLFCLSKLPHQPVLFSCERYWCLIVMFCPITLGTHFAGDSFTIQKHRRQCKFIDVCVLSRYTTQQVSTQRSHRQTAMNIRGKVTPPPSSREQNGEFGVYSFIHQIVGVLCSNQS